VRKALRLQPHRSFFLFRDSRCVPTRRNRDRATLTCRFVDSMGDRRTYHLTKHIPLQTNSRNMKTPLRTAWNMSISKNTRTASSASPSTPHHSCTAQQTHSDSTATAASGALSQDVSGVSKYNSLSHSRVGCDESDCDDMPEYRSQVGILLSGSDSANVDNLRIENPEEIAISEQR